MLRDSRDIIRRLRLDGFDLVAVRGSHHKFVNPKTKRVVIVPHPKSDFPRGTVGAIYSRPDGRRTEEFRDPLHRSYP